MKTNPKYRTYKDFLYKVEGLQLDDLVLRKVYTPSSFWRILKLDQLSNQDRTSELKLFKRFLTRYERQVYRGHNGYNEHFGTVEAQKILYVKLWANAKREESYVKRMLDIDHGTRHYSHAYHGSVTLWKPEKVIKAHPNYKYLDQFRKLRNPW
ncbi:RxLR effector protein [Phytophthora megakarya]|uniref:RxLR effector protein n=1 Tax=Phytophthora megakarya TaxID=4795 RepID=A0A225WB88_9STRA|nr:RxLR effector protein [Phytophthora megakarya]